MANLISIDDLSPQQIIEIISLSNKYSTYSTKSELLKDKIVVNYFSENSTRTLNSFKIAEQKLSANIIDFNEAFSSTSKGESLFDSVSNLVALGCEYLVLRHPNSNIHKLIANKFPGLNIINAGDGKNEHPTQSLLDAKTIHSKLGKLSGLNIIICGDIIHSRVAKSAIKLFKKLNNKISLYGPPPLVPEYLESPQLKIVKNLDSELENTDVVMVTRLQFERMKEGFITSTADYYKKYGIKWHNLEKKPHILLLHPGPVNRNVEIDEKLVDNYPNSLILEQVTNGVTIRQAVFEFLETTVKNS